MEDKRLTRYRERLVNRLVREGVVKSPAIRQAFSKVPRHLFVPRFYVRADSGRGWELVDGEQLNQYRIWASEVYSDKPLVIEFDEAPPHRPISSSSQPGVMALMLEALELSAGDKVLEIGTGSGYNAALLSEILGDSNVTSIDIDAELVNLARQRLERVGYRPTVEVADGISGYALRAPYDRLMDTCLVWPVPARWLSQLRVGGIILALIPGGMAPLTVRDDGSASGYFHPERVSFMNMRGHNTPLPIEGLLELARGGERRESKLISEILDAKSHQKTLFWQLAMIRVTARSSESLDEEGRKLIFDLADQSWFRIEADGLQVTEGGPRKLWREVEDFYQQWLSLGEPAWERFGLSVFPDGRHMLWLDAPDSSASWRLHFN